MKVTDKNYASVSSHYHDKVWLKQILDLASANRLLLWLIEIRLLLQHSCTRLILRTTYCCYWRPCIEIFNWQKHTIKNPSQTAHTVPCLCSKQEEESGSRLGFLADRGATISIASHLSVMFGALDKVNAFPNEKCNDAASPPITVSAMVVKLPKMSVKPCYSAPMLTKMLSLQELRIEASSPTRKENVEKLTSPETKCKIIAFPERLKDIFFFVCL